MIRKILISLILVFIFSNGIAAQQTGKITGVITEKATGEKLLGVNVFLENTSIGAATDIDGYYVILNVHPGTYTVIASMIGFRRYRIENVRVSSGKTTTLNFDLEEETTTLSGEIVVVAERQIIKKDLTSSELTVSSEEIEMLPLENLDDVLNLKAGVVTDSKGGIHIRGGRTSEVGYLIDGISVTDKFIGGQTSNVDVQFMEEVKVISGVFNAEYGQALSGIVDVITKRGSDKFEGNINIATGDYISSSDDIFFNIDEIKPWSINDIKANFSGPLSLFDNKINYSLSFRRYENQGWLNGQRRFNPSDSSFQSGNDFTIVSNGDNEIVSLNEAVDYLFQTKLNFDVSEKIKLSNLFFYDKSDFQFYNHDFKYNPDGLVTKNDNSFNNIFSLTYVFSDKAFLKLKYSFGYAKNRSYVFENFDDPGYANPELLNKLTAYSFLTGGTQRENDKRETKINIVKGDFLTQIGKYNEVKTGFEVRLDNIDIDNKEALYQGSQPNVFDFNRFQNVGQFSYDPITIAYYIQDKFEYESVVLNAGVRLDYFDSKGVVPTDYRDPENSPKEDAESQFQISPRIGVAFPISADGTVHFSYGHFFKIPDYQYVYANNNFRVGPGGLQSLIGNANLKAESTVAYELGLHYKFLDMIGLEVIGFYKDVSNLLGTEIRNTNIGGDRYALYTNRDYGKIRGITVSLFKRHSQASPVSISLDYTLQIAEANASDPKDAFDKAQSDPPKKPNIQVVPVNWDQRHTLNVSVFYTLPGVINLGLVGKFESGFPYTPENQSIQTSFENTARMPSKVNVDFQLFKNINIFGQELSFYAKIFNLFDTKNEVDVYRDTGRAGYSLISQFTPENQGPNTLSEYLVNPTFYSEPRRVILGLNYNLNF